MKYLKLFDSDSQYSDFINSDEFLLPSVGYVVNSELVHFNPIIPPKEITFTIFNYKNGDNGVFTALEGMTWREFCDSEYNTEGWYIDSEGWVFLFVNAWGKYWNFSNFKWRVSFSG